MAVSRFLAIDLGDSSLKAAEFVSEGRESLRLVNFGQISLELDASSEENRIPAITQALRKLLVERNFQARHVALSVSGQVVLTRFTRLPAAEETKMRQMVRFEAEQNVPFPMEEVVWDYQVIGERGEAELEVVMVAIKKDIIEGYNHCMEESGLSLEIVDVAPLAIYNAVRYNYATESDTGSTLIVDIGARTTNMIFVESKKVFTRSIAIAGNTITQNICQEFEIPFAEAEAMKAQHGFVGLGGAYEEPEDETTAKVSKIIRNVMTRLHAEISRSINFYKTQQNGKKPELLLLAGGTSILSYTDHFFKEKLEIEVEYFNPFKNIPIDLPVEELEKTAHSMGEVVGLGLRLLTECPVEINLLPPTVIRRRQFFKKIPFFAASLLGVLLIFMSWWLYYWKITNDLKGYLIKVEDDVGRLSVLNDKYGAAEADARKIHLMSDQILAVERARHYWLRFFEDFNKRIPQEIWVTKLVPLINGQPAAISGGPAASTGGPLKRPGRRLMPGPMPFQTPDESSEKPKVEVASTGISEFDIYGACLYDGSDKWLKPVTDFRNQLKQSQFIREDSVIIVDSHDPGEDNWTFTFHIKVALKSDPNLNQPVPY